MCVCMCLWVCEPVVTKRSILFKWLYQPQQQHEGEIWGIYIYVLGQNWQQAFNKNSNLILNTNQFALWNYQYHYLYSSASHQKKSLQAPPKCIQTTSKHHNNASKWNKSTPRHQKCTQTTTKMHPGTCI